MKVFGVTGLPGSGKSIISRIAKKEGIYTISMGDVIREEAEKQNSTTAAVAVNLRKKYGNNVVADRCVQKIKNHSRNRQNKKTTVKKMYNTQTNNQTPKKYKKIKQDIYIIEGLRSPQEVKYFKKHFKNFKTIAIHSNPKSRFNRLKRRKRVDDSTDYKTFKDRDYRELNFGIGNVIAQADYMLINEGPIPIFKKNIRALILNEIKPKHNKKYNHKGKNKNKNKPNRRYKKGRKQYKKHDSGKNGSKHN